MMLSALSRYSGLAWVAAAVFSVVCAAPCNAGMIWTEIGDAGNAPRPSGQPDAAQDTTGSGVLNSILGVIDSRFEDIDAFRIRIDDPDGFSAGLKSGPLDIADGFLFLFDENGNAVVADNDSDFLVFLSDVISEIPIGTLAGHAAGDYYIAVSTGFSAPLDPFDPLSPTINDGDLPVNASGELLFDLASDSLDSALGAIGPSATDTAFDHWEFNSRSDNLDDSSYAIVLTGASFAQQSVVPEPASFGIWAGVLITVGCVRGQRKRRH